MNKKVFLIIGSNSFSGSHLVDYILNSKHKVIGVSRSSKINSIFLPYKNNKQIRNFKFYKIDLNKDKENKKIVSIIKKNKIEYIVNFSAQAMVAESWLYPEDYYQTNILSLVKFVDKIKEIKFIKKFVHVSTPEVYGNINGIRKENLNYKPSTPYAISRAAFDMHLMALKKIIIFQLFLLELQMFMVQINNYIE